jgi:hypothetical protein
MIFIVLLFLLLLWYCGIHKGWLLFWGILSIITAVRGTPFTFLTFLILLGLAKVAIDIHDAGR